MLASSASCARGARYTSWYCEHVRPEDAPADRRGGNERFDPATPLEEGADTDERCCDERRRRRRERFRSHPGRAEPRDHDGADERRPNVEDELGCAPAPRPDEAARRGQGRHGDQDVRLVDVVRRRPKVTGRPDSEHLNPVERMKQVAELRRSPRGPLSPGRRRRPLRGVTGSKGRLRPRGMTRWRAAQTALDGHGRHRMTPGKHGRQPDRRRRGSARREAPRSLRRAGRRLRS